MTRVTQHTDTIPDLTEWFRSIGILREDGRVSLPILQRCADCRSAPGCGTCPGCQAGQVCHHLPPCPRCGAVQEITLDRLIRHPLHVRLYGAVPEREVFQTSNGALFVQSIAAVGIIEPILGLEADPDDETGAGPGDVLVLSGWRRVLAARACGLDRVPVRLVDPAALPRRADVDLVIAAANFQRQKTVEEIRGEIQVWKRAIRRASLRQPRPWELRVIVAKLMGISVRGVEQAEMAAADERLRAAEERLGLPRPDDELAIDIIDRLRQEQQPGDLRGSDILNALTERNEPLLSEQRDEVVHESINRAAQTAAGTFILDVQDAPALWPTDEDADESDAPAARAAPLPPAPPTAGPAPIRVGNLIVHHGPPDALPFPVLPAVDLIIAAPSWLEPLAQPFLTPSHVSFTADWEPRLRRCLAAWRRAIQPGGRLLLIVPLSTPLHPGLPVLVGAIAALQETDWAIGGTLVLDDPSLHGPAYAVPHPDQVLAPKGPARLILAAAPVLPGLEGDREERWRQSWAAPLSGHQPREVATVEEAALSHLWKYAGPGRRARWLPEFHPGLLYHLVRIFSRPDATVLLPELGGANMARGCLRAGRQIVALAEIPEQIAEVTDRLRRDLEAAAGADGTDRFSTDSLAAVTGPAETDREGTEE